jgi:hypothetical protein
MMRGLAMMERTTTVVVLVAVEVLLGCFAYGGKSPPSSPPDLTASAAERSPSWVERGISLQAAKRCDDLRALLKALPTSEVSEKWYELRGLGEAMCWSRSHREVDKRAAISAIEEGMQRYPNSAVLIMDKGGLLEMFGDATGAQPFYERAVQVATRNVQYKRQSRDYRFVLRRLGKQLPPMSAVPSPLMGTTAASDLDDTRPAWQKRAWQLMLAHNCRGAGEYLKANPLSETAWYAMYSQADLLCWQEGFGDQYKQHGLAILDVGLHSHRDSPRLLKSKAEYYDLGGDRANAQRFRQIANDKAKSLMASGEGAAKEEGEEVLNELRLEGRKQ